MSTGGATAVSAGSVANKDASQTGRKKERRLKLMEEVNTHNIKAKKKGLSGCRICDVGYIKA